MNWWQRLRRRPQLERELDAELQDHFDRQVHDNIRAGMSEAEARRRARIGFGGADGVKEACRDARGTRWVEDIAHDLRFAVRLLAKERWFTLAAVAALALGLGVGAMIITIMNGYYFRRAAGGTGPHPVRRDARCRGGRARAVLRSSSRTGVSRRAASARSRPSAPR